MSATGDLEETAPLQANGARHQVYQTENILR